jgi:hypothetical protein
MEWRVEENGKLRASISQVPLRLAYAITVHKSQGMSMDAAFVDLSRAFEYGQGYVALSRVRTLDGLTLFGFNERALEVHPSVRVKDRDFHHASDAAEEAFGAMSAAEIQELQKNFVTALGGTWIADAKPNPQVSNGLSARLRETLEAVRGAQNLEEAADERGLTIGTVVKHLEELAELGQLVRTDVGHLLSEAVAQEIYAALDATETTRLAPVFNALQGAHSFESIRLARLMRAQEASQ